MAVMMMEKSRLDKKGISAENSFSELIQRPKERSFLPSIIESGIQTKYDYLKIQRHYAPSKAMRNCSRFTIASLVKTDEQGQYLLVKKKGEKSKRRHYIEPDTIPDMTIRANEFGSSISGLQTCDNPYCVMCARSKSMERAEKIATVLKYTGVRGWRRHFVTLTIQRQADPKRAVQDIQERWRAIQKMLQYRYEKKQGKRIAFARAVDVTFRPELEKIGQCYHVHLHTIILIEDTRENFDFSTFRELIVSTWCNGGDFSISTDEQGQDVQAIGDSEAMAKYVAKMGGLGLELAHSQTKRGKNKSLSLPQLLEKILDGETHYKNIYQSFLQSMKNVRTMSFSALFDEIAEQNETESQAEYQGSMVVIPPTWWSVVIACQSSAVRSFYHWHNSDRKTEQIELLKTLMTTELHPKIKPMMLERWMDGTLTPEKLKHLSLVNL